MNLVIIHSILDAGIPTPTVVAPSAISGAIVPPSADVKVLWAEFIANENRAEGQGAENSSC